MKENPKEVKQTEEVVNKFHENIGMKSIYNNVMETPEKEPLLRFCYSKSLKTYSKIEKNPEEVQTEETQQLVTDIITKKGTNIINKSIFNKSDEMFVRKPIYETIKPKQSEETNINNNTNDKRFVCDFNGCDFQTDWEPLLSDHLNIHRGLRPYKCHLCEKAFHSKKTRASHRVRVHNAPVKTGIKKINPDPSEETNNYKDSNNKFICSFIGCGYQTYVEQIFKDHLNIHSGLKPYECDFCDKTFHSKRTMFLHRALKHSNIGSIKCPVKGCERKFIDQFGRC